MKKIVCFICSLMILLLTGCSSSGDKSFVSNNSTPSESTSLNKTETGSLVVYFSATGNTAQIAEYIKNITNSDSIRIEPKNPYTDDDLDYNNDDCRANKEQKDNQSRPEIKNTINIDGYETVYLGYPIWWGDAPKIIFTLLDSYDFRGKTIIPFCTSGSSDINKSLESLKEYNNNLNIHSGKRFSSSSSKKDVETWLNEITK